MAQRVHLFAAMLAMLCIAIFFTSTILVELPGSAEAVAQLKRLIVTPGLWILVPAVAAAGANGLLVLVPCAIVLDRWASAGAFGTPFIVVQAIELAAGAVNLSLMALNARDGLRLSDRRRPAGAGGRAA